MQDEPTEWSGGWAWVLEAQRLTILVDLVGASSQDAAAPKMSSSALRDGEAAT